MEGASSIWMLNELAATFRKVITKKTVLYEVKLFIINSHYYRVSWLRGMKIGEFNLELTN